MPAAPAGWVLHAQGSVAATACIGRAAISTQTTMARIRLHMQANVAHAKSASGYDSIVQRAQRCADRSRFPYNCRVTKFIKFLIVWLMLLTVPLQGFASVTQLWCTPTTVGAQLAVHTSSSNALAAAATDHEHAVAASGTTRHTTHHHHPDGKCGACASCCFGAAMTPSFIAGLPQHTGFNVALAAGAVRLTSVDLDLPERPPRA